MVWEIHTIEDWDCHPGRGSSETAPGLGEGVSIGGDGLVHRFVGGQIIILALQLTVQPEALSLRVGDTAQLEASAPSGVRVVFFSTAPQLVSVTPQGAVTAHRSGEVTVMIEPEDIAVMTREGWSGESWSVEHSEDPNPAGVG